MSIRLYFFPYDEVKGEYKTSVADAIPFDFGMMTTHYYQEICADSGQKYRNDYNFYLDNVLKEGTNLFLLADGSASTVLHYGITPSDFTTTGLVRREHITKFRVKEDLFAELHEEISINPEGNGKASIYFGYYIVFTSPLLPGTKSRSFGFQDTVIFNDMSFEEFISLNNGRNITLWYANQGNKIGLNAYPYNSEDVEESKTTTGCMIQEYRDVAPHLGFNRDFQQHQSLTTGIVGSVVKPWSSGSEGTNTYFYVPKILGSAYEPEFELPIVEDTFPIPPDDNNDKGAPQDPPYEGAVSSGAVRLYQMTDSQILQFANFLWSTDLTTLEGITNNLKHWFSEPLESVISLTIAPVDLFYDYDREKSYDKSTQLTNIKIAGYDTGVQGYLCDTNYKQIDCGIVYVRPYFNSYLDCNPHTKISIYLPYIGFKELNPDVLFCNMGSAGLRVVYNVDLLTGVCVANLQVAKDTNGTELEHVIYTFTGNINTTIPLTSANMGNFLSASIGAVASAVAIGATGGAATPLVAGAMATQQAMNVATQKLNITHNGGMSLEGGMFAMQYPYLVVTRPREVRYDDFDKLNGIPTSKMKAIRTCTGFTQVERVNVAIDKATTEERNEIEKLLKEGIII